MIRTRDDKEKLKGLKVKGNEQDFELEIKRLLLWEKEN